jgi:hypothetical protein
MLQILQIHECVKEERELGKTVASMSNWLFTVDAVLGYIKGKITTTTKKVAKVIINLKFVAAK